MPLHIQTRLETYFGLLVRLKAPFKCLLTALREGTHNLRDRTFALWMAQDGHHFTRYEDSTAVARLTPQATGVVLDVGAGWGSQVARFDKTRVAKIYGIEPNANLIPLLRAKVEACGLQDVYEIVVCGIEDEDVLAAHGITPNTIDTIVCMQVLCSVPNPSAAIRQMHSLLKPGGKFLFWEHQRSRDLVTSWVQRVENWIWRPLVGGCCLDREVERAVFGSGVEWEVEELGREGVERVWELLPRVWGVLGKKR